MSKPKSFKQKTETALIADEPSLTTPISEGTSADSLPFQEFSDQDVNSERWDNSILAKVDKALQISSKVLFEDPQVVPLPPGVVVHEWKRYSEIHQNVMFVVFSQFTEYPDLITPNQHLLGYEFYRDFISTMETLLYIGSTKPFSLDCSNPGMSTFGDRAWRPWNHIYSNCKISKGEHSPVYNPAGKYVVRLFWMGTWRKVYVDDFVPVDKYGKVLLPTIYIPKPFVEEKLEEIVPSKKNPKSNKTKKASPGRKEIVQLWPLLLIKAILKVASLSSYSRYPEKSCEFDMMHMLTGWVPLKIKTKDLSSEDLWEIFMAYVPHFAWAENKEPSTKKSGSSKTKANLPKKGTKTVIPLGIEYTKEGDRYVILSCRVTQDSEVISKFEGKNLLFLGEVRDIPIIQPPPRPELEFWKKFRYEKWAVEQGILSPDIKKLNIQSLKLIDPFRRIKEHLLKLEAADISHVTDVSDNTDKKSEKSSKSSKKSSKSGKTSRLEPDPTFWTEFRELQNTIDHVTIYFQTKTFKEKSKISDMNFLSKTQDFKHIVYPIVLKETRNEPIYVFMDSVDWKFIVINLAQTGDAKKLEKYVEEEEFEEDILQKSVDMDFCDEVVLWKTRNKERKSSVLSDNLDKKSSSFNLEGKPVSLVMEEYCWSSNVLGRPIGILSTYGTKSFMVNLPPGRVSFRLWLHSHCSYVLQLLSDTHASIGCLEEYLIAGNAESQLLTKLSYELSSCFGKLVQSLGRPEYPISLKNFYQTYKPHQYLTKSESATAHRIFFEEFAKIIEENTTANKALYVIKLLFLQLKTFDYVNPYVEEPHLYPDKFVAPNQVEYAKIMQRAAVRIQAFFKRIYVKLIMKKMEENHKEYFTIFDSLKKIYSEVFSKEKRLNYCPTLIRRFFEHPQLTFRDKFEIFQDIQSVLQNYTFTGNHGVHEFSWVPICRYEFHVIEPVFIKISLFCNLKTYFVRAFDNDTTLEVKQYLNNVMVNEYHRNINGYTVLCYGWSDDHNKVNWKLVLTTKTKSRSDFVVISPDIPATLSLRDNYIPNYDNIICRYIVRVIANSFLTVNLSTSYRDVEICLKLLDKNGKKLLEVSGVRSALFPIICLQRQDSSSNLPAQKKLTISSGVSDITYSKLTRKSDVSSQSRSSGYSKKSSTFSSDGSETGKRHRKRSSGESGDADDEMSFASQHTENDTDSRASGRRSQHKSASRFSASKRKSSSQTILSKSVEYVQNDYILEAKVINASWPLTKEQWDRVQKLRERSYLNLLDEKKMPIKKFSVGKKSLALEEPFWTLDLIYDSKSSLEFEVDHSESDKRKAIKNKWFSDIERYRKGVNLRKKFIAEHTALKTDFCLDPNKRSNDPKEFSKEIIVGEPLEKYMIKPLEEIDEDLCNTKSADDYIIEESNVEREIKQYQANEDAVHEEIDFQLQEQKENFAILSQWFEEVRAESSEMMNEVLAIERDYIKQFLAPAKSGKSEKKSKGKKKK